MIQTLLLNLFPNFFKYKEIALKDYLFIFIIQLTLMHQSYLRSLV